MRVTSAAGALLAAVGLTLPAPAQSAPLVAERDDAPLERFRETLERFRAGEDALATSLDEWGRRLADELDRDDVRDVATFFLGLGREARMRGWSDELRYREAWERVREARAKSADWPAERAAICDELAALEELSLTRADFTPAARAASLRARLLVERIQRAQLAEAEGRTLAVECAAALRRARELFARAGMRTPTLEPTWLAARLERLNGSSAEAARLFRETLALARAVDSREFEAHALAGLAALAEEAGDVHALDGWLDALAALRPPDAAGGFDVALRHARRLLHRDEAEAALAFLERHEPPHGDASARESWQHLRANALARCGEVSAARRELAAIADGARTARPTLAAAQLELAAAAPQRAAEAIAALLDRAEDEPELLDEEERALAHALHGEALLALDRPGEAAAALLTAFAVADRWSARVAREFGADTQPNVLGERLGVERLVLLAEALLRLDRPLEAATQIEGRQALRAQREGDDAHALDLLAWAASAEHGILTFAVGADRTIAVHVAADGSVRAHTLARGREELRRAVRRLREALRESDDTAARALGSELLAALVPADTHDPAFHGRLLFVLHGPLEELPIEWLCAEGVGFSPRVVPLVLPGLPAATPGAPRAASEWLLCGDPLRADGAPELRGARAELAALAERLPAARVLCGDAFRREDVLAALTTRDGALHVATHLGRMARVGGGPLDTDDALLCSDGELLTASEIAAARPCLSLCVLSACATGGGRFVDGQGLHGVARAFLEGGTRNVVCTLWPVEDGAASRFGSAFHEALGRGETPSVAAHSARQLLRREGFGAAAWAAFRALGRE